MRKLYIACYDISDNPRRRRALRILLDFASGRQYSVFECFLSEGEKTELLWRISQLLEPCDKFLLIAQNPHGRTRLLGTAMQHGCEPFCYLG